MFGLVCLINTTEDNLSVSNAQKSSATLPASQKERDGALVSLRFYILLEPLTNFDFLTPQPLRIK